MWGIWKEEYCRARFNQAENHSHRGSFLSQKKNGGASSSNRTSSKNVARRQRQQPGDLKAVDAENLARYVVSHQGKLQNLRYPWLRIGVLNFGSSTPCEEPARQRELPFCFQKGFNSGNWHRLFLQSVAWR